MLVAACVPWAGRPLVSPAASGLVGEWIEPVGPGQADTTLWRFAADGKSVQVRIKPPHEPTEHPLGAFQVYADTGGRQLICFAIRRGRTRAGCRYFQVDTLHDASGGMRRQLRLLHWTGEKPGSAQIWSEKAP